ncbi:dynamin family protein [Spirulina sp. CS-785/01]|uniref:dynamin family protein n=1 Tax=Spirulina sp. CS-785/01 TaxID=3021716 RepID=UPI002330C918|nr:dynamin family protein [Spirulina sp. CS-785/01]MDB9315198.1 dynamin family protein [Spirulina sp. CS-785/01]
MSSQLFQKTYESLADTGPRLLQYLQRIHAQQLSEGDDTEALRSIEGDVLKALYALSNQKYQVAVVAAMKAGKSTFLNALIGADVLASETESCTVCRTDILPVADASQSQLLEYRENKTDPVVIAEGNASLIRQYFLERTHIIRASANRDRTVRFQLKHPIAAIRNLPPLKGFTLVDTPGPNEWKDTTFDTIALKETAFDALRNCDVILFILDYSSFKDSTNSELLQELIEQRSDFLRRSRRAIYFILNKIDRKTEEDRPIQHVIDDLRRTIQEFGIPNPLIYPVSAWQGLLAKLIDGDTATENHMKNFKRFFSGRYARETEDGDLIIPSPKKIAPQALEESLIPIIEQAVIGDLLTNAGWNLLRDVSAKLDKGVKSVEDILNARIRGWQMEIKPLRQRMEAYKQLAKNAIIQIREVKQLVEQQEQKLIAQFKREITDFAERAKQTIHEEFERFVQVHESDNNESQFEDFAETEKLETDDSETPEEKATDEDVKDSKEQSAGSEFHVPQKLQNSLKKAIGNLLQYSDNPYIIHCGTEEEVEQIKQDINHFCSILIKDWWTDTQDKLSREGTIIRQELVSQIQDNIQTISNELSEYLGDALEVNMNINPIQMLVFDFQGIDAQVQQQTENYTRWTRERKQAFCRDYEVDIQVDDRRSYYEIDMRLTINAILRQIDAQTLGSLEVVERVIKKQISDDFQHAEQQINDYIHRFLVEFDRLVQERENREAEVEQILETLEAQAEELSQYKQELNYIQESLEQWKPEGN